MDKTLLFQGLFGAAIFLLLLALIFLLVSKSRNTSLQNENDAYQDRLNEVAPYKIGQMFYKDEDNIPDEVVVSLAAHLIPVQEGSSAVKLMSVLDRFFKDPAKMFDEFYDPDQPFGVILPITRVAPSSTRINSYFIVVKDLAGQEYYLMMEGLPEYMNYKLKIVSSKK